MKRFLSVLLVFLLVFGATACSKDDGESKDEGSEAVNESDGTERPAYVLKYSPSSDGEVVVSDIYVNDKSNTDIHVVIPESSPNGNKIAGVNIQKTEFPVLRYMTSEDFDSLISILKDSLESNRLVYEFEAYYLSFDYNSPTLSDEAKESILNQYPFANAGAFVALDNTISFKSLIHLSNILKEANVNLDTLDAYAKNMGARMSNEDAESLLYNVVEASKQYKYCANVTRVTFPSTINFINAYHFEIYDNLKAVDGLTEGTKIQVDDLPNFQEFTQKYGFDSYSIILNDETAQWFASGDFGNFLKLVGESYLSKNPQ